MRDRLKKEAQNRVLNANLSYPILTRSVGEDERKIIDGSHRAQKALKTGDDLSEIVVPDEIMKNAEALEEVEGKQYAPVGNKMIDVEKLWNLTSDMTPAPLDPAKIRWTAP